MNDDDKRLSALFHDAVSDVEPRDRLADVRRRTRARRTSSGRRWAPVLVGAGAVAATVVAAAVVVNGLQGEPATDHDAPVASSPTNDAPTTAAAAIYYTNPTGERLYREFQVVGLTPDPEQRVLLALQRLTEDTGPRDPDYRTVWPDDSFEAVRIEDDRIVVELGESAVDSDLVATLAAQQVVYTAEAALLDTLPVAFESDGAPVREVLGVKVDRLVERDRSFAITAPVNISDPSEELAIEDGVLQARGIVAANVTSPVRWSLQRNGQAVRTGRAATSDDSGSDATLFVPEWTIGPIDLSGLPLGDYVFEVTVTSEGQTSDSPREFSDTRTITLR
jgi:hypothetical protein